MGFLDSLHYRIVFHWAAPGGYSLELHQASEGSTHPEYVALNASSRVEAVVSQEDAEGARNGDPECRMAIERALSEA